jgi:hypothetical protein
MIVLSVVSGPATAAALTEIKLAAATFPGEHPLTLVVRTPEQLLRGEKGRRLTLGPEWSYEPSAACLAALGEFGRVEISTFSDSPVEASRKARPEPNER